MALAKPLSRRPRSAAERPVGGKPGEAIADRQTFHRRYRAARGRTDGKDAKERQHDQDDEAMHGQPMQTILTLKADGEGQDDGQKRAAMVRPSRQADRRARPA